MAIWRSGKPDVLLHNSDQGSQYTSEQFQKLMAYNGIGNGQNMGVVVGDLACLR